MVVSQACFACSTPVASQRSLHGTRCKATPVAKRQRAPSRRTPVVCATSTPDADEEMNRMEMEREMARMRARLAGLFGTESMAKTRDRTVTFDGAALRESIESKWGVQYDVQPQKRHGRVYLQIMWRYFEQQSFYLEEDDFAAHCEAVAQLLNRWDAVDYFLDWISNIKKRPVVGICLNIPIPEVEASEAGF